MKLKNLSNYTQQELTDVITQVKAHLQVNEETSATITLVNYQEQEDDEQDNLVHYEIYESNIDIDEESTYSEVMEHVVHSEKLVKTYKTKKGLLQAMLNDKDVAGERYRIHTIV
ncbi:hypothetical protein KJB68_08350 [Mammaliicoccus sciuri]|uniref:hypothetical protein n=1 Tax=Mammaliicoccus sciuri TaxID=1296 RepID=UPI001F406B2D|nr:hypothetical protein [Mammaliicoccus sciuri]MCE5058160.1 hypothetical protein [Mammaliicoccus sciuri]